MTRELKKPEDQNMTHHRDDDEGQQQTDLVSAAELLTADVAGFDGIEVAAIELALAAIGAAANESAFDGGAAGWWVCAECFHWRLAIA
ncbi:hypothetical protein GCM10007989_31860 [Devosia pacifica]|uniref:Uncharacterized protein n=1 Tax=Devosia pacifica TaxID=1335967 RepID=A0A918VVI5_9HYPH|nr:hypothetical protein GCM10007989_31860 [Devosia pacifica]